MDRFPSMHDEDIGKLGIPAPRCGEDGRKGRKRARELSLLKGTLDKAAAKEQNSWNLLKEAIVKGGPASKDGRFAPTGSDRAAEEMRTRTVGLVTADEFRVAREAAKSMEAEAEQRRHEQLAAKTEEEAALRKAERKRRKAHERRERLNRSKMSFGDGEDEELERGDTRVASQDHAKTESSSTNDSEGMMGEQDAELEANTPGKVESKKEGETRDRDSSESKAARNMTGASQDDANCSAALKLKQRLEQAQA